MELLSNISVNIIAGIIVSLLSYVAGQLWVLHRKTPWIIWRNRKIRTNLQGVKDLEKLISALAQITLWLGKQDIELLDNVHRELWHNVIRLQEERLVMLVLHAKSNEERGASFRELASINENRATDLAQFVSGSPTASSSLKSIANSFIDKKAHT